METAQRTIKPQWMVVFVLALAIGALGFTLSYQDERTRFSELGQLAQAHFVYALQLKDDMALIDWSKNLEKLQSVQTFRAVSNSKIIAEGGNQTLCPSAAPNGISFNFPYQWIVCFDLFKDSPSPVILTLVFQDLCGPLFWGIGLFCICFVLCWALLRLGLLGYQVSVSSASLSTTPAVKSATIVKPILSLVDEKSFTLTLDKDYMICQVTPLAAQALDRLTSDLVGSHFLDLLPAPAVMKAIEESKEIKLSKPFPSHPHLSAWIRPMPEGINLVLEREEGA